MPDWHMHCERYRYPSGLLLGLVCLSLVVSGCKRREAEPPAEPNQETSEAVAPLDPVNVAQADEIIALEAIPVWEVAQSVRNDFVRGSSSRCTDQRGAGVAYPEFHGDQPLFGSANLQDVRLPAGETTLLHFTLDRSSGGVGDYDRLYVDLDGDLDLTDEEPLKPMGQSPAGLLRGYAQTLQETCFACVEVPCDFGPAGVLPLELCPRLRRQQGGYATLDFIGTKVHHGKVTVADQEYDAYLGYEFVVGGRLDNSRSTLRLIPSGGDPIRWWGGDRLSAIHLLGGQFYRFSCRSTGDELYLLTYAGPLGTFELGAGDRAVAKLEMYGSLRAKDTAVPIEDGYVNGRQTPVQTCELPEGDYYPAYLTMTFDDLQVSVSNNYHAEGGQYRSGEPVMGIKIREDRPFVLDFSDTPEVMFVQPAKDYRVVRGDELKVEAVLIDPGLDIMLRRLYKVPSGGNRISLDPKVVIKRVDGEVVAEGVMPFG